MPFKDLEHGGGEDFETLSNRVIAKKDREESERIEKATKDKMLSEAQVRWLSPSNPLLWDRLD